MEGAVVEKAEKTAHQWRHERSESPVGEVGAAKNWKPSRSRWLLISLLHSKACFLKGLTCPIQGETLAQLHPLDRIAGQESN